MIWKGKKIVTYRDMTDAIELIVKTDNREEAQEFMKLALTENSHARENVGYLSGYFDNETKHRIFELFGVKHPIFGCSDPTFGEAYAAGQAACKEGK